MISPGVFDTEIEPLTMSRGVNIIMHVQIVDIHVAVQYPKGGV